MTVSRFGPTVIVGIDGSPAAMYAAEWAAAEAYGREVPLLMLAILKASHPSADDYQRDLMHAETSLREARAAVEAEGLPVKVETDIRRGQPGMILVSESDHAELICVGSTGIGRYSRALLGSTATEVAELAHCPVAVIRSQLDERGPAINWIVVAIDDSPDRDIVVDQAMKEAALHKLPVLAIGPERVGGSEAAAHELSNRLEPWRRWFPDLHIYPVTAHDGVAHFVKHHDDLVPMAVIGGADADQLAQIIGPYDHPIFRHPQASALIIRE